MILTTVNQILLSTLLIIFGCYNVTMSSMIDILMVQVCYVIWGWDIQVLLNSQTRSLASLLIHHPFRPTKAPHCQSDLEIHRHCDIAHPQIICIIVVLKVLKLGLPLYCCDEIVSLSQSGGHVTGAEVTYPRQQAACTVYIVHWLWDQVRVLCANC